MSGSGDRSRSRSALYAALFAAPAIVGVAMFFLAFTTDPDTPLGDGRLALRSLYFILAAAFVCLTVLSALLIVYLSERSRRAMNAPTAVDPTVRKGEPIAADVDSRMGAPTATGVQGREGARAAGSRARAIILRSFDTGILINEEPRLALLLRIRLADGAPFTVEKQVVVPLSRLSQLREGSEVEVLVDASDPTDPERVRLLLS